MTQQSVPNDTSMDAQPPIVKIEYAIHEAEEQLNDAVKMIKKHKTNISSPAITRVVTSIRKHIKYLETKL